MIDGVPPLGDFRWKVELQSSTVTADAFGQHGRAWATYATAWAVVEPQGLNMTTIGDRPTARLTVRMFVRWLAGVLPSHRVLWDGKVFNVGSVIDIKARRRFLELIAEEVADAQA